MNPKDTATSSEIGRDIRAIRHRWWDVMLWIEADFREGNIDREVRDVSMQIARDGQDEELAPLRSRLVQREMHIDEAGTG